mmetsp:Transcript_31176/g.75376  ORF Transcript_31176/g.75376 Transcript_31176/m.75376 type:complete len:474 (+) Transcript_31176:110-1531(+)|eukprot:CAMPEP_0181122972 /NCGR_PEP_ID=MMETSP1071-20121207/25614_1 /TAXON_ID=35127 /ORGANISM="Thalassiosira sp., Strain NH16" /LENGTH=473 /DNA_ID=CAMNT_0023208009 /DNA_START=21 /DNA_END=1439 /DNA_ORIENTATION=+
MVCKYSGYTWFILLGMILSGSVRSIVVKLAYQSGFQAPLSITLLYLLGQSFSLFVYWVQRCLANDYKALITTAEGEAGDELNDELPNGKTVELGTLAGGADANHDAECLKDATTSFPKRLIESHKDISKRSFARSSTLSSPSVMSDSSLSSALCEFYATARSSFYQDEIPNGSNHGLSIQSEERIKWVHTIPFYAKPAIPAVLNLLNSALRWASLVYIDASVAEMMISGLELTLSVVAARIFRKRMVAKSRWIGVAFVAIGVIIIERANNSKHKKMGEKERDDDTNVHSDARDAMIGVVLIVLQSILSVLQDIGEEIFMQATDFPATMMLGMEGMYGFCIGLIIYMTVGDRLGVEDIDSTISMLSTNARLQWWVVGLPFLFLITGIFNIKATEVTSAMTRNVWKNLRTVFVWAIALGIFYLGHNSAYGETWHTPESDFILFGFSVMTAGIIAYYWYKEREQIEPVSDNNTEPK